MHKTKIFFTTNAFKMHQQTKKYHNRLQHLKHNQNQQKMKSKMNISAAAVSMIVQILKHLL